MTTLFPIKQDNIFNNWLDSLLLTKYTPGNVNNKDTFIFFHKEIKIKSKKQVSITCFLTGKLKGKKNFFETFKGG